MDYTPIETTEIVVTAARVPERAADSAASVTIIDTKRIARLGEPLVPALLRLVPSTAVATSGPAGSLAEVRIRGAEANHTLLFIDGIRANDPAAGNAPRFELLNADLVSRIEVVRGPQSALWGSEAIGGVIAVDGDTGEATSFSAATEAGSFGFRRATASVSATPGAAKLAAAIGWQRARGIDIFGGGDRDGYRNLSGRARASWDLSPSVEVGASGFALTGRNAFDGSNPFTFAPTQDLASTNKLAAGQLWIRAGSPTSAWSGHLSASLLGSKKDNFFAGAPINQTSGGRTTLSGQIERRFSTGGVDHQLIGAADHESERFQARDTVFGGFSAQDRTRQHQSLTVEWRAKAGPVVADVAVRHDRFNRFKEATSLRVSGLANLGHGLSVTASYGEGIAQPTFFDLYGFFPGSFIGNPSLRPESSRGVEASLRYRSNHARASFSIYRQRLSDEIVDIFGSPFSTTINRDEKSRRSGIEAEFGWQFGEALRVDANYAYLKASEPGSVAGSQVHELRRPKHSGSLALDGTRGRFSYGASIASAGTHDDMNFDVFPFETVRLHSYWLGGARVAFAVSTRIELFARAANAFDAHYQDVFGYRTEGRSLYAGIRLADRR
ncbi:TonB-dependent receptor domain-containing protein [Sphingomonas sp.]|uniref:TonB-dependent receptor plug domain-containing protein n=1 Tax=Sphingomonas sp. TaxID=28214 RepID=UPI00286CC164|nr:TonB-dependent receptor [Sphingomonas sp.]